ncbi:TIGR01777 family oxidoreductase [Pseudomonas saudiphocaensis]|uniref:TIGR01777 family oxidoreductase n=1 Tax=Pseudomonas saudiphocaensis TaxID=1499686 RepID=UPI000F77B62A|nr:TIGR01777 family oxidoreductase [Pseudomonas saudiphocaensis]RRV15520.1 TIGR01777 family protein [Pseudomonas saudiphocaensis]
MRILLTGGTGLIGRALCRHWLEQGHELLVWSRRPEQVPQLCGAAVRGVARLEELGDIELHAVINLAGAPIAERHWTRARKALLWESRINLTERLVDWLAGLTRRPQLMISGSAVGWYGDAGERQLREDDPPASSDFASQLCIAWEESAQRAQELGIRVILIRTGLVLARDGGFLTRLLPPFRLGLGGRIGDGRQWMPWIHLQDQVALIDFLLHHPTANSPYNACAPQPVRNAEFTRNLAQALHRPALLPLPAPVLRVGFGELSGLLLGGQHVLPERLSAEGFRFRFSDLPAALADLLDGNHAER